MTTTTTAPSRGFWLGTDISATTTVEQMLDVAGLNWDVRLVDAAQPFPLLDNDGVRTVRMAHGYRFAVRTDTNLALAVVGPVYATVQNRQAFALAEAWLKEGAQPTRGGALEDGARTFMEFDFPQHTIKLAGGKDLVTFGGRITTSHTGNGKVVARVVGRRLWCMNGCTAEIKGLQHEFKVSHTSSAQARLAQGYQIMAGAGKYAGAFADAAERMLATPMTDVEFGRYIDTIFPPPPEDSSKNKVTGWENRRAELMKLWKFADTNQVGRYTRWGGFNSVTEYLDWNSPVRQGIAANLDEARQVRQFDDVWQATRTQAFTLAA
jgi:phage/plasmid-like protein (TIGR03299 family)